MDVNNLCQAALKMPQPKNERKESRVDNVAVRGRLAYHIQNGKKIISGLSLSKRLSSLDR